MKTIDGNKTSDAQKRAYKKWVEKNKKRRNEIALKSYHKVKALKNKSEEVA